MMHGLTIEVIKAATSNGAICVNYVKVEKLQYNDAVEVDGADVVDRLTGDTYSIKAKKVVNATGPWVDRIREMDESQKMRKTSADKRGSPCYLIKVFFPYNKRFILILLMVEWCLPFLEKEKHI